METVNQSTAGASHPKSRICLSSSCCSRSPKKTKQEQLLVQLKDILKVEIPIILNKYYTHTSSQDTENKSN